MKKKLNLVLLLLSLALFMVGCSGTSKEESTASISDSQFKFNTIMTITLYGYTDTAIFKDIWAEVDKMESSFSANIETSDVSKFNASTSVEPQQMPRDIVNMIDKALPFSEKTGGKFDLTIEPVVKLWGISTENPRLPAQAEIDAALTHVDYKNIKTDMTNSTLQKLDPNTHIDLGGIAKGYAADQLAALIKSKGIERAILNLGGNIYAVGSKTKDTPWNVGIQNPFEPNGDVLATLKVVDKSIVTSGSYERFFEKDGVKYHHILSPFDGYPINSGLISVSIISEESVIGDILSTSTFSLGLDEGRKLIDDLDGIAAVFVTDTKDVYFAGDKSLLETFELQQEGFTLKE